MDQGSPGAGRNRCWLGRRVEHQYLGAEVERTVEGDMRLGVFAILAALLLGCSAPAQPAPSSSQPTVVAQPTGPKRMTIGAFVVATSILDNRARPVPELVIG